LTTAELEAAELTKAELAATEKLTEVEREVAGLTKAEEDTVADAW
jgi:hypothetical protein